MRFLSLALLCAFLAVLPAPAPAAEPFNIDAILSLTGYAGFIGAQHQLALKGLEEAVNRSGGINGQPVHFAIVDDQSNPATATQLASQIIARGAPIILGPSLTGDCEAVFPRILESGPLTYCFSPALYPAAGTYAFASGPSTRDLNVAALRYFRLRGWTRVALLTTTDASGQDGEKQGLAGLALPENKSLKLVANEHFGVADLSIAAQISRIAAARPQAILAWVTGTPTGTALHGIHDNGLDVPVMLNAGDIVKKQIADYSSFMPSTVLFPGLLYMTPELASPAVRATQTEFTEAFSSQGAAATVPGAFGYEPARVVIEAFRHVGTKATAKQLRDYIETIKGLPSINGLMNFTDGSQRGSSVSGVVIVRWDNQRQTFVPVSKPGGVPSAG